MSERFKVNTRKLRSVLQMTQEEMARELAVTVSTVNRWDCGRAKPSSMAYKMLQDLCGKHDLALSDFFLCG